MESGVVNLYLVMIFVLVSSRLTQDAHGKSQVPCFFIFGDSMVDCGNNNHLATKANVNYQPYGIDFPSGPTGRYSNGRTVADVIAKLLGFENFIKSFPAAKGSQILKGVNYASGYAGIRDETGKHMGAVITLNKQLNHHKTTISRLRRILKRNSTSQYLHKCLYLSVIGNNDYINNYFLPRIYKTSSRYSPEQYADVLIKEYARQMKVLYNYGARKVALAGSGAIGCTPNATAVYAKNGTLCADKLNHAATLFNNKLKSLVRRLNKNLTSAKFIYLENYSIITEHVASPGHELITGCCPVNEYGLCIPHENPCLHRGVAIFWDSFHPAEYMNLIVGTTSYDVLKKIL